MNDTQHNNAWHNNNKCHAWQNNLLSVVYAEWSSLACSYAECRYVQWSYAECRCTKCRGAAFLNILQRKKLSSSQSYKKPENKLGRLPLKSIFSQV